MNWSCQQHHVQVSCLVSHSRSVSLNNYSASDLLLPEHPFLKSGQPLEWAARGNMRKRESQTGSKDAQCIACLRSTTSSIYKIGMNHSQALESRPLYTPWFITLGHETSEFGYTGPYSVWKIFSVCTGTCTESFIYRCTETDGTRLVRIKVARA